MAINYFGYTYCFIADDNYLSDNIVTRKVTYEI